MWQACNLLFCLFSLFAKINLDSANSDLKQKIQETVVGCKEIIKGGSLMFRVNEEAAIAVWKVLIECEILIFTNL